MEKDIRICEKEQENTSLLRVGDKQVGHHLHHKVQNDEDNTRQNWDASHPFQSIQKLAHLTPDSPERALDLRSPHACKAPLLAIQCRVQLYGLVEIAASLVVLPLAAMGQAPHIVRNR